LDINALNQNKFIFGETIAILFLLFDYPFGSIVLGGTLREHEARAAATARSQDEVAAAIDRLNGGV
jgi:hypothetical protein